jgi:hypothetical protein
VGLRELARPHAITMWDFSWLERRWPGAGYESVDTALDELVARGYDAVRIDAYPHLIRAGATERYTLTPVWTEHDWGAPHELAVAVQPALVEFVAACHERGVKVALSSWFRRDLTDHWRALADPYVLADAWNRTIEQIDQAGLRDALLFVDLANEAPVSLYNAFLYGGDPGAPDGSRKDPRIARYLATALDDVREANPDLDLCFSFCSELEDWEDEDVSHQDLLELHLWIAEANGREFERRIGYDLPASNTDPEQYRVLAAAAEPEYRRDAAHWLASLDGLIERAAAWSRASGLPLATTECWGPINYKDAPGLDWGWVKEVCEHGVRGALSTGRWVAVATSNFAGPQFKGMWSDVEWHQRLTSAIRASSTAFGAEVHEEEESNV